MPKHDLWMILFLWMERDFTNLRYTNYLKKKYEMALDNHP